MPTGVYIRTKPMWNKGKHLSRNHKLNLSKAHLGKHHTPETKLLISKNNARIGPLGMRHTIKWKKDHSKMMSGKNHPLFGKHHSEITRELMRRNHADFSGKKHPMYNKHHTKAAKQRIGIYFKGKKISKQHKENISKGQIGRVSGMKGKHQSIKARKLIAIASSGRTHNSKTKEKMRISAINYIINKSNNISPRCGKNEKQILDEIENKINFKIIRNHPIIGYFLDGYCQELNLAIEVDEDWHFNTDGSLREKDIIRQQNIEKALNCKFLRVRENEWLENKEVVC